jgi:hypothetical protein
MVETRTAGTTDRPPRSEMQTPPDANTSNTHTHTNHHHRLGGVVDGWWCTRTGMMVCEREEVYVSTRSRRLNERVRRMFNRTVKEEPAEKAHHPCRRTPVYHFFIFFVYFFFSNNRFIYLYIHTPTVMQNGNDGIPRYWYTAV